MKKISLLLSGVMALATPNMALSAGVFDDYTGDGFVFEFNQTGFSDGGVFSGAFVAEDLDGNGQIESFAGEVYDLYATYQSGLVDTVFDYESLEFPPNGSLTGLVYSLDGRGTIGDDNSRAVEGFALDNGTYYYAAGPGPFQFCDGVNDCGYIAEFVEGGEGEFLALNVVEGPINDEPIDEVPNDEFPGFFNELVIADTADLVRVTSGPIGHSGTGTTEADPFMPVNNEDDGFFAFDIPVDVVPGQLIFIDPVVAVGYTYEIEGSTFASVQAPSLAAVNDPDGYILTYAGGVEALAPGEEFFFVSGITEFTITGINPVLELDPTDDMAFVTGISLTSNNGSVTVTQTPITEFYGNTPAVPLPASLVLGLSGLGGLGLMRRRKPAA